MRWLNKLWEVRFLIRGYACTFKKNIRAFSFFSIRGIKCLEHDQSKHWVEKKDQPIRIWSNRGRVPRAGKNLGYNPDQSQCLSINKLEREENTLYSLLPWGLFSLVFGGPNTQGTHCSERQSKMCLRKRQITIVCCFNSDWLRKRTSLFIR